MARLVARGSVGRRPVTGRHRGQGVVDIETGNRMTTASATPLEEGPLAHATTRLADLVVVANRLPIRVTEHGGARSWSTSPGGLVSALEAVLREREGLWVGWAESAGGVALPESHEGISLKAVPIGADEYDDFYVGFANATLWPLYHDAIRSPTFDRRWWHAYVTARPSVNKMLISELARCGYIDKRENVLLVGNPGTGKSHLATALAAEACARGYKVRFYRATELVTTLIEARDERSFLRLKTQLSKLDLLVLDELGYVPASKVGAELLFDVISTAYERTSMIVTTNLPFESWTEVLGSERLTGATLDRLTHRCRIIETKGESYRLHDAKTRNRPRPNPNATLTLPTSTNDRIFGEDNNQAD